jgi:hypothetical protein
VDIYKTLEINVREDLNISGKGGLGYYDLKYRTLFYEECSKLLHQRKQVKIAKVTRSKAN